MKEIVDLTREYREKLQNLNRELNEDGLRMLAVAYRHMDSDHKDLTIAHESNMIFAGYIAFLDPPKQSTTQAICELHENGVTVKVLTGNAAAVCKSMLSLLLPILKI
ncbi:hypothetical protein K7432_007702 [Basidiobolus ranarum]|uniref:Uncharacterized protein n=1 Tax=Basidiobolus ranarum TaxID=34480 RepID=A0ABR2VZR5_9FUNG